VSVAAITDDADKLRELDAVEWQAWLAYSRRLRDLTGEEYERAESDSWAELQRELGQLAGRRKTLTGNST
jgi:hypothetical protein